MRTSSRRRGGEIVVRTTSRSKMGLLLYSVPGAWAVSRIIPRLMLAVKGALIQALVTLPPGATGKIPGGGFAAASTRDGVEVDEGWRVDEGP